MRIVGIIIFIGVLVITYFSQKSFENWVGFILPWMFGIAFGWNWNNINKLDNN